MGSWLRIPLAADRVKEIQFEQLVLSDLKFNTMEYRRMAIPNQHNETFQWIYDTNPENSSIHLGHPHVNLKNWVESESGLH
jgi:hypothetical protein